MSIRPARRRLLVALAGLSLFCLSRGLLSDEGKYVVVGKDGSMTSLAAPPDRKGDRFVGRLLRGGQLVSLVVADVDEARTAAANAPRPEPVATPSSAILRRTPIASSCTRRASAVAKSLASRAFWRASNSSAARPSLFSPSKSMTSDSKAFISTAKAS